MNPNLRQCFHPSHTTFSHTHTHTLRLCCCWFCWSGSLYLFNEFLADAPSLPAERVHGSSPSTSSSSFPPVNTIPTSIHPTAGARQDPPLGASGGCSLHFLLSPCHCTLQHLSLTAEPLIYYDTFVKLRDTPRFNGKHKPSVSRWQQLLKHKSLMIIKFEKTIFEKVQWAGLKRLTFCIQPPGRSLPPHIKCTY